MKETPLIFTADSVRAILEGRKTQTRRVIVTQPKDHLVHGSRLERSAAGDEPTAKDRAIWHVYSERDNHYEPFGVCPYGVPGDRLWGKEECLVMSPDDCWEREVMYADGEDFDICVPTKGQKIDLGWRLRRSMFMPRWASRLTLEITDIRVQRVQEISEADAIAEGCELPLVGKMRSGDIAVAHELGARHTYAEQWNAINARRGYPWKDNPWVWAITFRRLP